MNGYVLTTASRSNRSIVSSTTPRRSLRPDPPLLLWRRLLDHAIAEAKKTIDGLPTDLAILARWWISDCRPSESSRSDWERSFDCACHWLNLDAAAERRRILREIDAILHQAWLQLWFRVVYVRRAMVLSCAGQPTAIAGQFMLPLAAQSTYDEVAGIEKPDMFAEMERSA